MNHTVHSRYMIKKWALFVAGIVFSGGIFLSIRNNPSLITGLHPTWMLILLSIGIPVTILLNAFEFHLIVAALNRRVLSFKALEISIIGSAANMLPLPGAVITRVVWLKSAGINYKESTSTALVFALIWAGVSFSLAGGYMMITEHHFIGATFLLAGISAALFCVFYLTKKGVRKKIICLAFLQRITIVCVDACRIWICFKALGVGIQVTETIPFTISSVVGSAVSIVPAGLGMREGAAALLSPLAGISPAAGFLASALNRLAALVMLSPLAFLLSVRNKKEPESQKLP
ncbi:MAG: lysylphosphatidylglycerol synthase domain-containing protein [Chitinivibrionales bacterium]